MRIRRKPWARPELAACPYFISDPAAWRGRWRQRFARPQQPFYLELGCGKGGFAARLAFEQPQVNLLALDLKSEMLAMANRKALALFGSRPVENLLLASQDIERISQILAPGEGIERIYINFCNPWPQGPYKKHRLTHPRQLAQYSQVVLPGAQLHFKTDHPGLFEESLHYFTQSGLQLLAVTRDLHHAGWAGNIPTEHEEMFAAQGQPIYACIACWPAR